MEELVTGDRETDLNYGRLNKCFSKISLRVVEGCLLQEKNR